MLGEKIKTLRTQKGKLQKDIAKSLNVNVAYISKIENHEKPVSEYHLPILSRLFEIPEEELRVLWLADKLCNIIKNDKLGLKALKAAEKEIQFINDN